MSNLIDPKPEPPITLSLKELTEAIVRYRGLHEGLYGLAFQFQIAAGAVGPTPDTLLPGAMFGISSIGLEKVDKAGPMTVDAAAVNPDPAAAKRLSAKERAKPPAKKGAKEKI